MALKAVILAGGIGSRLSEETVTRPKPMVEIGERPILWHIMKIYSAHGIQDFVICLGYKGYVIKEYFLNYSRHNSDLTVDLRNDRVTVHRTATEPWTITLVDTGLETLTGGRLKRVAPLIEEENFLCTYGDGVGNVDMTALLAVHEKERRIATVTAVAPTGRYGMLEIDEQNRVLAFLEKPHGGDGWINAGFFAFHRRVFDYLSGDMTSLEDGALQELVRDRELTVHRHSGFWQAMDTLRDKRKLDELCEAGRPPWFDRPDAS